MSSLSSSAALDASELARLAMPAWPSLSPGYKNADASSFLPGVGTSAAAVPGGGEVAVAATASSGPCSLSELAQSFIEYNQATAGQPRCRRTSVRKEFARSGNVAPSSSGVG
jgi:hypothetical protein